MSNVREGNREYGNPNNVVTVNFKVLDLKLKAVVLSLTSVTKTDEVGLVKYGESQDFYTNNIKEDHYFHLQESTGKASSIAYRSGVKKICKSILVR